MVIAYDRERSHRALMRGHQSVRTLEAETKTAGTTLTLSLATVYGPCRPFAYKHRSMSGIVMFSPTINYAIGNCIIVLVEVARQRPWRYLSKDARGVQLLAHSKCFLPDQSENRGRGSPSSP